MKKRANDAIIRTGWKDCPDCLGDKYEECVQCDGAGTCYHCGAGCFECAGSGDIECPTCFGEGGWEVDEDGNEGWGD